MPEPDNHNPTASPSTAPSDADREALLTAVLDALDAAVAVVDAKAGPLVVNRAWKALVPVMDRGQGMTGAETEPFMGCLPPFAPLHQRKIIADGIRSVAAGAAPAFYGEFSTGRDDADTWYGVDVRPFALQGAAAMIRCRDVSERRKARQSLEKNRDHLYQAQKMEALGTLVAGVAHEINNPISLMMFNLPILRRVWQDVLQVIGDDPAGFQGRKLGGFTLDYLQTHFHQLIDDMDMAASRVSKIVRDLKNFSRQSQVSDKEPLQVNTAVTNAVRLARATLDKSGVVLSLALQEDLPPVYGNLTSIEQIVLNILINAVQAIDAASGRIIIRSGFRDDDGMVFISVTDNGRGVSPAIADKVFDPFVTDKQAGGGSGLGLAVSYSLAKAHGGAINFAPAPDGGTTFVVDLPSARKKAFARVLVVDDDAMVRRLIVQMLSKTGRYRVEEAGSGVDGLLRIGTRTPDLLILDLKMPGMNGLDVCRAVRRNDQLAGMKVLITTGHPNHPDLEEIKVMGYTDCYVKPLRVEGFREMVDRMMRYDGVS